MMFIVTLLMFDAMRGFEGRGKREGGGIGVGREELGERWGREDFNMISPLVCQRRDGERGTGEREEEEGRRSRKRVWER